MLIILRQIGFAAETKRRRAARNESYGGVIDLDVPIWNLSEKTYKSCWESKISLTPPHLFLHYVIYN